MIMPSKYLREDEALLGAGATLLHIINGRTSFSNLWEDAKNISVIGNFERFVLALDLLFLLGLVDFIDNQVVRLKL
ncbi:MAG: ABC-three component system middle component 6 [Gammaproteobacteria bacterium]